MEKVTPPPPFFERQETPRRNQILSRLNSCQSRRCFAYRCSAVQGPFQLASLPGLSANVGTEDPSRELSLLHPSFTQGRQILQLLLCKCVYLVSVFKITAHQVNIVLYLTKLKYPYELRSHCHDVLSSLDPPIVLSSMYIFWVLCSLDYFLLTVHVNFERERLNKTTTVLLFYQFVKIGSALFIMDEKIN